jgi:hypothetical protein
MIVADYFARLVGSEDYDGHLGFTVMELLAADLYWHTVRAGVAGRRTERGDVVAVLREESSRERSSAEGAARSIAADSRPFLDGEAWAMAARTAAESYGYFQAAEWIAVGYHLGAARRSR